MNQCVKDLDEDDLTEYFYHCKMGGNNSRRMKGRMSALSAFFRFLRKKRFITENPMEFIDRPKHDLDVLERLFLTEEQVTSIKSEATKLNDTQFLLYISLSLSTLARVNAISNITWAQIDFEHRIINNVLEKEQRMVELYFSKEVKELLLQWKKEREEQGIDNDYVFITKYGRQYNKVTAGTLCDWSKKAGMLIGIKNCHPHTWRKSGATIMKNRGATLEAVSHFLNHLSTETSRKFYIKEDTKKLQAEKDKYEL
jgi:site-specific recombinase XerD